MIRDTAAKRYARAAFEVALERGVLDRWSDDLRLIAAVMGDAKALALLANTKVPLTERYRLLEATLAGIDSQAMNLARLLVAKGRAALAPQIAEAYLGLVDAHRGLAPSPPGTARPPRGAERPGGPSPRPTGLPRLPGACPARGLGPLAPGSG